MILLQKLFIYGNDPRPCMTKYKFTLKVSLLQIVNWDLEIVKSNPDYNYNLSSGFLSNDNRIITTAKIIKKIALHLLTAACATASLKKL